VLQVFLCALVSCSVCARLRAQLRGNISPLSDFLTETLRAATSTNQPKNAENCSRTYLCHLSTCFLH